MYIRQKINEKARILKIELFFLISEIKEAKEQYGKAIAAIDKAIGLVNANIPEDLQVKILYRKAYILMKMGKYKESIAYSEECLHLKPNYYNASKNLGYCTYSQGNQQLTIQQLKHRIDKENGHELLHFYIARAYERLKNSDKAREHYKIAIEKDPQPDDPLRNLYLLEYREKNYTEAAALTPKLLPLLSGKKKRVVKAINRLIMMEIIELPKDAPFIEKLKRTQALQEHKEARKKKGLRE